VKLNKEKKTYEYERDERQCSPPFASSANGNCANRSTEDKLKLAEENRRYCTNRVRKDTSVEGIFKISNNTRTFSVGKRIANSEPLDRANSNC